MIYNLAYADSSDPSTTNLIMVLGGLAIIAGTAILALILIFLARARKHPYAQLITVAAVFWALITAASLLYAETSQMNWSKEYTLRLQSGYLDPNDTSDAPQLPWAIWTGLCVAYGALLVWTISYHRPIPSSQPATQDSTP